MAREGDGFGWRFVLLLAVGIGFTILYMEFRFAGRIDKEFVEFHMENNRIQSEQNDEIRRLELRIEQLEASETRREQD